MLMPDCHPLHLLLLLLLLPQCLSLELKSRPTHQQHSKVPALTGQPSHAHHPKAHMLQQSHLEMRSQLTSLRLSQQMPPVGFGTPTLQSILLLRAAMLC
jgi:hypothetical protein